jgi:hypothetical protein
VLFQKKAIPEWYIKILDLKVGALRKKIQRLFKGGVKQRSIDCKGVDSTYGKRFRELPIEAGLVRVNREASRLCIELEFEETERLALALRKQRNAK